MSQWQKKKPGDPLKIPAGAWNALLELLEQRDNFLAQLGKTGTIDTRIKIRNDTGADLGRYQVVRVSAPIVSPTDNLSEFLANPCFSAAIPDGEHNRIAIVQEPIAAGAIGWAVAAGLTHAYVSGNESHGFAVPIAGDCTGFASAPSGPVAILWRETGTGLRRCFVRVGNHPMDVRRLRLLAPLTHCGEADALLLTGTADEPPCDGQITVTVRDSLGVTSPSGLPAGAFVWAVLMPDAGKFEVISYGFGCCEPPSQSDSDQSDSDQSDSGPSESSIPSESSAPSESSGPSESSQSQPSESSASQPSESQPPSESDWSAGSDKSTAIVPASFSPTGYAALFIHEMPEVRFDDVMVVKVPMEDQEIAIDPRFIEVCHKGTIEVCGIVPEKPILVGARAVGDKIRLSFAEQDPKHAVRLVLRLTGIRRGFAGKRFPRRTREQFLANEAFINSAYPHDPRAE
ncbi:MAG TPA: hypothetical protein PKI05_02270 [Thermogutta sp.]|nr:hypothetical protein [Thermogutta sp.]